MSSSARKKKKRKKRRKPAAPVVCILILIVLTFVLFRKNEQDDMSEREQAAQKQESLSRYAADTKERQEGRTNEKQNDSTDTDREKAGWNLILVNPWHSLPDDFSVELADLPGGHQVDVRCRDELLAMLDDCRAQGLSPLICSSYRTMDYQESLYEEKVTSLRRRGMNWEDACSIAARSIAYPGTSEHQTGLAVDIVDENHQLLDSSQEQTKVQKWLIENSWKYGFILRYPNDKSELTGIIYEPWHYRYVGKDTAKEIYEQGVCLEEYLDQCDEMM